MNSVERNQAIGLVIITGILLAYFTFFSTPSDKGSTPTPSQTATTIAQNTAEPMLVDTTILLKTWGDLAPYALKKSENVTLENENIKVLLNSKGATLKSVELKKYKTYSRSSLVLIDSSRSSINNFLSLNGKQWDISGLSFNYSYASSDSVSKVVFTLPVGADSIQIIYTLSPNSFLVSQYIQMPRGSAALYDVSWTYKLPHIEKDLTAGRNTANINFKLSDGTYGSLSETSQDRQEKSLESRVSWVSFKQKFFTSAILSPTGFQKVSVLSYIDPQDTTTVKCFSGTFSGLVFNAQNNAQINWFFGPNKLSIVRPVADSFEENVYLGWPVINTINRYTIAPLFSFLENFSLNYGLIIILMVLIIKAVLFPLSYRAYYSMAKIKVLKPELDEIKSRVGEDMTALQQEQMKLYNQVGVNPLSGCIPVLLQMPVLLAMFNFFPNAIELRHQPFLWADDLSAFDSILDLPFKIPFYGDHVSLFTLLMTASTILYTWYNNQSNVSATGPMLAMSYIMPLVFMFVLNSMPAGLSFYYFVSNMITIGQQYIIKLFVDESSIRAKLEENKKNSGTKKPNRFQQRLLNAMQQQQDLKKVSDTKAKRKK